MSIDFFFQWHPYQVERRPMIVIFSVWLYSNVVPSFIKAFHFKIEKTGGMRRNRRRPISQYHRGIKRGIDGMDQKCKQ